jgi:hypothetical protein
VLGGETDTLVRGSEGVRGLYRYGEPVRRDHPDFLWRAGDGRRQPQLYVVGGSDARPRLRPVNLSVGWSARRAAARLRPSWVLVLLGTARV